jgi:hypothetical protein
MDQDEMVGILEAIARDTKQYPSARVTAIRTLGEMRDEDKDKPDFGEFESLYAVAPARRFRTKGPASKQ